MPVRNETIDATNMTLGRLASAIAVMLRGKDRATYNPASLPSVKVTVTNASKIRFSGKKLEQKKYYRFSGYPGGLRTKGLDELFAQNPERVVRFAVLHMLPDNKLKKKFIKGLTVTP